MTREEFVARALHREDPVVSQIPALRDFDKLPPNYLEVYMKIASVAVLASQQYDKQNDETCKVEKPNA